MCALYVYMMYQHLCHYPRELATPLNFSTMESALHYTQVLLVFNYTRYLSTFTWFPQCITLPE